MTDVAEMRFFSPESVAEVAALLGRHDDYRCLAGGGLVVPALREGTTPAGLVSLRRVAGLHGLHRRADGTVGIGAMTTHAAVMESPLLDGGNRLVRQAAAEIAHPAIRNMATIGGTLCRADPSADYGCALLAAGAMVHLCSEAGERSVAMADFALADRKTVRREDELLTAVTLPPDSEIGSSGYVRFARVDGDYPVASAAVRLGWQGGRVATARVVIGGCGPTAYLVSEAGTLLAGTRSLDEVPAALISAAVARANPRSDLKGSPDFRLMLIPGLLRRALSQAFEARG